MKTAAPVMIAAGLFFSAEGRRLGHKKKEKSLYLFFNLRSAGTNLSDEDWCLDISKDDAKQQAILNPCVNSESQKFAWDDVSEQIRSGINPDLCLDVTHKKVVQSAHISLSECAVEKRQTWNMEGDGIIRNKKDEGFCLSSTKGKFRKRAPISLEACPSGYGKNSMWSRVFVVDEDDTGESSDSRKKTASIDDDGDNDDGDDFYDDASKENKHKMLDVDDKETNEDDDKTSSGRDDADDEDDDDDDDAADEGDDDDDADEGDDDDDEGYDDDDEGDDDDDEGDDDDDADDEGDDDDDDDEGDDDGDEGDDDDDEGDDDRNHHKTAATDDIGILDTDDSGDKDDDSGENNDGTNDMFTDDSSNLILVE